MLKLLILFSLSIIILYYLFIYILHYYSLTSQKNIDSIYKLLSIINCEFNKNNVEYIIIAGTLLGAVRNDGLIPWDHDADISIINKSADEIMEICEKLLLKYNIIIERFDNHLIKIRDPDTNVFIDIIILLYNDKINKYTFIEQMLEYFPNEYWYKDEIYPIKYSKFGNLILPIPNNPIDHLNRVYPKWNEYYVYEKFSFFKFKNKKNDHVLPSNILNNKLCY